MNLTKLSSFDEIDDDDLNSYWLQGSPPLLIEDEEQEDIQELLRYIIKKKIFNFIKLE